MSMNKESLKGTYIITAVDYVSSTTLSPLQQSRIGVKINKDEPLGRYERLGSILFSIVPYKSQEGEINFSQSLSLEVSDLDLKQGIEARVFGLDSKSDEFRKMSFSPKTLEDRLKGTMVDIILNDERNVIPNFTYQEAQEPVEDRQLKF